MTKSTTPNRAKVGARSLKTTGTNETRDTLIAQRSLMTAHGQAVQVLLFRPSQVPGKYEEWACPVHIVGGGDAPSVFAGSGVDAFQSIISALQGIRARLREMPPLSWLGELGEAGFPLIIPDDDQDFVALIEHLAIVERSRLILAAKARQGSRSTATKKRTKR